MQTIAAFCASTPGQWLKPAYARRLAKQGRIGYWDKCLFVPACEKVGPRAWIITCDNPVIRPPTRDMPSNT